MDQSYDLTAEEAVAVLVDRHEVGLLIKEAAGIPTPWGNIPVPDISQHVQNVITPPAGNSGYAAANNALLGAGAGALAGAGSALLGKRRKDWLRRGLTGAIIGGGIGAAVPSARAGLSTFLDKTPTMAAEEKTQQSVNDVLSKYRKTGVMTPEEQAIVDAAKFKVEDAPPADPAEPAPPPTPAPPAQGPATPDGKPPAAPPAPPAKPVTPPQAKPAPAEPIITGEDISVFGRKMLNPSAAASASREALNQNDFGNAAADASPIAARSLGQGALGYAGGQALDLGLRRSQAAKHIPHLVQDKAIGTGLGEGLRSAIANKARPGKPVGGVAPTTAEWGNLRASALKSSKPGKLLPRGLGAAAALQPIISALFTSPEAQGK